MVQVGISELLKISLMEQNFVSPLFFLDIWKGQVLFVMSKFQDKQSSRDDLKCLKIKKIYIDLYLKE